MDGGEVETVTVKQVASRVTAGVAVVSLAAGSAAACNNCLTDLLVLCILVSNVKRAPRKHAGEWAGRQKKRSRMKDTKTG